ncbi:hypothetical protein J2T13_000184 [Paenibacillus sp. DS2015]|uniref:hypothetical protein n=1 Tax=Paenibacillus sp. DS2015 TaxID=3373917 RepID=UPI003D228CF4
MMTSATDTRSNAAAPGVAYRGITASSWSLRMFTLIAFIAITPSRTILFHTVLFGLAARVGAFSVNKRKKSANLYAGGGLIR